MPDVDLFGGSCGSRFGPSSSDDWQVALTKELGAEPKIGVRHGVIDERPVRTCDYSISFASAGECGLTWSEHDLGGGIGDYNAVVPLGASKVLCGTPVKCECPPGR